MAKQRSSDEQVTGGDVTLEDMSAARNNDNTLIREKSKVSRSDSQDGDTAITSDHSADNQKASAFEVAQHQLAMVAQFMGLDDDHRAYLSMPQRELIVHFPVEMDDGSMRIFEGYRIHHNMVKGPTKGGIRYHPEVTLDECRARLRALAADTST